MALNMVLVNSLVLHPRGHSSLFSIINSSIHHNLLSTPTTPILSHSPTTIKIRLASVFLRTALYLALVQYFILEVPNLVLLDLDILVNSVLLLVTL